MVDIDKFELNKKDINLNLKIKCDAKYFLQKLFKKMRKLNINNHWIHYCQRMRKKYPILIKKMIQEKKICKFLFFHKNFIKIYKAK